MLNSTVPRTVVHSKMQQRRRPVMRFVVMVTLGLGMIFMGHLDAHAQGNGAVVIRTPEEGCFVETSPGVFEPFTCNNIDVYTPNDKIRTHASGELPPPEDGNADVIRDYPTDYPVCDATISASGKVRF